MLLELKNISKKFTIESKLFRKTVGYVKAVDDVSLSIAEGKVLGLVGESGSGKTTLGKIIAGLINPDSGQILWEGKDINLLTKTQHRTKIQMVFQDPFASLNPRLSIGTIIGEVVKNCNKNKNFTRLMVEEETKKLLDIVGLQDNTLHDYPHQFSGGQRQRIGIARALAMKPKLIIADEPVSSLDISIQAQILNLLMELKEQFGLAYLFIAHDLSVINFMADRVTVMKSGVIIEQGTVNEVINSPQDTYTQNLLDSVPRL